MIIRKDKTYEASSLYPNTNWYEGEDNYVINETTEEGKKLAKRYIDNYPFVEFRYRAFEVIDVIVLQEEKAKHDKELETKRLEEETLKQFLPSREEIAKAELELQTMNLLQELGVI